MKRSLPAPLLVIALLFAIPISGQTPHQHQGPGEEHRHEHPDKLGRVNFPVSCSPAAQRQFNRAVAWLHSFEYEEAEKAFHEVTVTDPKCGMGYWGMAMTYYHALWVPPSAAELKKGWEAVEKAKSAGPTSPREHGYISAMESFYKDADKLDHRTRVLSYSDAMDRLHTRYPADREAGIFYALTLITKGMMAADKTYANEKKAAQILNRALAREPQHPGVSHYLIHSYDYPALAHLALPAARSYAKIAPASAHAQHMPSHIFTRMGLWQDAIKSNLDAKAAAEAFARRNKMPDVWDEQIHAMDYLVYAYLQSAQDKKAMEVLDELKRIRQVDPPTFKVAYAYGAIPARVALERRRWAEAAQLPLQSGSMETVLWPRFRWAQAQIHFARAIGAARTGDAAAARKETENLAEIRKSLTGIKGDYDWGKQVDIKHQMASAWLAYAEGKHDESITLMRAAADLDDATDKHPVTPGSLMPAREQLGELLLELKRPTEALAEFESALTRAPNRFNGLYGAARAAKLAADTKKAKTYYGKLITTARLADSVRPELEEARQYLGAKNLAVSKK